MVKAQEWLEKKYPISERNGVIEINNGLVFKWGLINKFVTEKESLLEGELILDNWPNLKEITFTNNQLTRLEIRNCPMLTVVRISDNYLTYFYHDKPEILVDLSISNNNFVSQDLNRFRKFINLEILYLGYNTFFGSLEPLKILSKLRLLEISQTDLDSGLEYLPESVERIYYYVNKNSPNKVKKLRKSLKPFKVNSSMYEEAMVKEKYELSFFAATFAKTFPVAPSAQDLANYPYYYNYQGWRKENSFSISRAKLLVSQEQQIQDLKSEISANRLVAIANPTNLDLIEKLQQEKVQLEKRINTLQQQYQQLLQQVDRHQELLIDWHTKKKELTKLIKKCKFNDEQELLNKKLLEAENNLTFDINTSSLHYNYQQDKEEITNLFRKKGFKHIDELCWLQREITQLGLELINIKDKACLVIAEIDSLAKNKLSLSNCDISLLLGNVYNLDNVAFGDNKKLNNTTSVSNSINLLDTKEVIKKTQNNQGFDIEAEEKVNVKDTKMENNKTIIKEPELKKSESIFTNKQIKEWINAGFTNNDSNLITFLQEQDYQSPQEALMELKNIIELRNKHQKYLEYKNQIEFILKPSY